MQGLEQAAGFGGVGVEWFEYFEVSECGGVELEEGGGLVIMEGMEVGGIAAQSLGEVVQGGTCGADGGGVVAQAESIECGYLEVFVECKRGGFGCEGPVVVGLEAGGGSFEEGHEFGCFGGED